VLRLNVIYPYPAELVLGAQAGTAKSINRQVDLLFDLLTAGDDGLDDAGRPGAAESAGAASHGAAARHPAPRPTAEVPSNDAELARLRAENTDLKKVLAELLVQKAALHGKLRAAT
jgi:hypothetical protein